MKAKNRFTRRRPCPICDGFDSQERGRSKRCYGFISDDGNYVHCTCEEYAGGLTKNPNSDTYAHWLVGDCNCGVRHDPLPETTGVRKMKDTMIEYDYVDEHGELLYQVCRTPTKDFFQRRPDSNGGWINNLKGVRRVLYRLPELLAADKGETVFICEGEKDADALRSRGLVATTNAGGAGKWRDEYNAALMGRTIVILPDNDQPGREHAKQVAESFAGVAACVRVVELPNLPDKGDVSDWLAAGGTAEQLQELAENAPEYEYQRRESEAQANSYQESEAEDDGWICAADVQSEPIDWLWKPYIALGKLTLFDGDPGVGKSWATCALAAAVSRGFGLPGVARTEARTVLMLSAEDGLGDTLRPRLETFGADLSRIVFRNKAITFNEQGLSQLEDKISQLRPALIIIDPLFAFVGGKVDIYRDNEVRTITTPLAMMAEKYKFAVVALRHLTKQQQKAIYAGGGTMGLMGAARTGLLFGCDPDNQTICGFVHAKTNLAPLSKPVGYKIEETPDERGRFSWVVACDLTSAKILGSASNNNSRKSKITEAEEFLCDVLGDGARHTKEVERLAKKSYISPSTLRRAKENLNVEANREIRGVGAWWWKLSEDKWPWIADAQDSLFSNEHVPQQHSSSTDTTIKPDAQAAGHEHVVAESRHSNEHVVEHELTSANNTLTDIKADAQTDVLGPDEHVQESYRAGQTTELNFDGRAAPTDIEPLKTVQVAQGVRRSVEGLFGP